MEQWPAKIRIAGLPIWLWGWCTDLQRTEAMSEDAPIYAVHDYPYFFCGYFICMICGIYVRKWNGQWILYRNDDRPDDFVLAKWADANNQSTPIGRWWGKWVFGWVYDPSKLSFYGWI